MKILIYVGHPAQYFFVRNTIKILESKNHEIKLVIKSKDVLETLVQSDHHNYSNILSEGRKTNKSGILWGLIKRDLRLLKIALKFRPDIFIGSDPSLAHAGKLLRIPIITVLEDDYEIITALARLTYPFTSTILVPSVCRVGPWDKKKVGYNGYMKLAYLHPNYFVNKNEKQNKATKKILIRTSKLNAHHDFGIGGLSLDILTEIINTYQNKFDIYISTESEIFESLKNFSLNIEPSEMHTFLSECHLLISDSQSMSMEAAMIGIPSVRFSDFTGRISVLDELEKKYSLTFGFKTNQKKDFFAKINELLTDNNLTEKFQQRRNKMLEAKIDVTKFLVWFIENYPTSVDIINHNPNYQYNFK